MTTKSKNKSSLPEMPDFRKNFDYDEESFYHGSMDRFDSVKDFLDHKMKKRKEAWNYWLGVLKQAQEISVDTTLVDKIKEVYSPKVQAAVENALSQPNAPTAVSSIPIRIFYENKKATLVVQSTGTDAQKVDELLNKVLNAKFSAAISQAITQALKGQAQNFNFGLVTLEFNP